MTGEPRIDYERVYLLLPQTYGREWVAAFLQSGMWDSARWTFGSSADDAGIGNLTKRTVIAVNPHEWPDDLEEFFTTHYPGVSYLPVVVSTPDELEQTLRNLSLSELPTPSPTPIPSQTPFPLRGLHDLEGAWWLQNNRLEGWCCVASYLGQPHIVPDISLLTDRVRFILRLSWSWARNLDGAPGGGAGTLPHPTTAEYDQFIDAAVEMIRINPGVWGFTICNEMNNPREWPERGALTPTIYEDAYRTIYNRAKEQNPHVRISPGPVDPFNPGWGDWRNTWFGLLNKLPADFIALHAYSHHSGLVTIDSDITFSDDPLIGVYYNLRVLDSQLDYLSAEHAQKPIVITEMNHWARRDGTPGWDNDAGEWVTAAYEFVRSRGVVGACLFRYDFEDWSVRHNGSVLDALRGVQ